MSVGTKTPKIALMQELTPVLSDRCALSWKQTAVVGWFALSYILINHMPVSLHSVWWHINQGNWIVANGAIPTAMPHATYAEGLSYVPTTWLSDVITAIGVEKFGLEYISAAMAIFTTFSMGLWCWLCSRGSRLGGRKSQGAPFVLLTAVVILLAWSFGLSALRSQVYAGVLFPILLWLVWPDQQSDPVYRSVEWCAGAGLMALWANLDASFFLGVAALFCIAIDRIVDAKRRIASTADMRRGAVILAIAKDPLVQQSVLLAEFASVATLASPRGWQTWLSVLQVNGRGPLWSVAGGDFGLRLASTIGLVFGVMVTFAILVWQFSKLPKRACDVCLFAVVVVAAGMNPQNIYWLAPVALFLVSRHWSSVFPHSNEAAEININSAKQRNSKSRDDEQAHRPMLFAWTLLSGLFIWFAFAFSPISAPILGAKTRSIDRILDKAIPVEVGSFLQAKSKGVICAPADWSEWLAVGNRDETYFVNSRLRQFPVAVQRDYGRIFHADEDWDNLTKQYNIKTLVIDKQRQAKLAKEAVRSGRWQLARESDRSMILFLKGA